MADTVEFLKVFDGFHGLDDADGLEYVLMASICPAFDDTGLVDY